MLDALVPQALIAFTLIFPDTAETVAVAVIEFVVAPAVIVQPVGTVHT